MEASGKKLCLDLVRMQGTIYIVSSLLARIAMHINSPLPISMLTPRFLHTYLTHSLRRQCTTQSQNAHARKGTHET